MRWKYIIIFFGGVLLGGVDGGLYGQEWNKPIHYSAIIINFGIFPLVYFLLSLTQRSLKELIKLIVVSQIGLILAWSVTHFLVYGWLFDDPIMMLPVLIVFHSAYSFVIHELRFVLPEKTKEKGLLLGISGTFGIMWGKVHSLIKPVYTYINEKPKLKRIVIFYIIALLVLLVLHFGFFGIGAAVLNYSEKAQTIREGVGRKVVFDSQGAVSSSGIGAQRIRGVVGGDIDLASFDHRCDKMGGILTEVGYQYEWGKLWIIYFRIAIEYESQNDGIIYSKHISATLSPFELDRIKFVVKNE